MDPKLSVGDKAPDFRFKTPWDKEAGFYEAVGEQAAVLIFLRYYGCPVCRMEMVHIKEEIDAAKQKKGHVFVILQSAPEALAKLTERAYWPFTIVSDPRGNIFQIYGVEVGGIFKYLHPAGLIAAVKAISRGFRHGKFEGKETQLPAAFAVDTDKIVRYAHYGKNIGDVPPLSVIMNGFRQ